MALTEHKLGEFIELRDVRNSDFHYGADDVRGVNNLKLLMPTKADLAGRDLSKFQIVYPDEFVFNHRTSRNGSKFSIAYNDTGVPVICTEDYVVFRIKEACKTLLDSRWLYMFFNRPEFDRYVITNSWGSSTEFYNWEDICEVSIPLPPIEIQQKYVNIYNAMVANQRSYEGGLEDLRRAVFAEIDIVKHTAPKVSVGKLLEEIDVRNTDGTVTSVQGINIEKQFMPSIADTSSVNLKNYKVVRNGQFAYSSMQTGRDECIRIALYDKDDPILISPAYSVLKVKDSSAVAEYIMLWFTRPETDRYGSFASDASVRANLDLDRFYEIQIPLPDTAKQQAIANIYIAYMLRKEINAQLKLQIRDICPILIKGSIEEASA